MKLRGLFGRKRIVTTIGVLLAGIICARLGFWQLDRLAQKRAFNDHIAEMRGRAVLALPTQEELVGQEHRAVRATGTYDFEGQVALRNRIHNGQYGYHLLTPLRIGDTAGSATGVAVLVDRGWIPASGNDRPEHWRKYDDLGLVTIEGTIRLGQNAPSLGGLTEPTRVPGASRREFWLHFNLDEIRRELPYQALPVYVQLSPASGSGDPPIASPPVMDLTDGPHLGYAVQWFGFAGLLIVGYPFHVVRRAEYQG
jgi:surfeit locus 1 family protein